MATKQSAPRVTTTIEEVLAAIETARDKVMADERRSLTKMGLPKAEARRIVDERYRIHEIEDEESGW